METLTQTHAKKPPPAQANPLRLKTLHHIEFWVGNARQAAYYYRHVFGFSLTAYAGLETHQRALTSYVLSQGKARFVLSSPESSSHPASEHLKRHGDGVRDIAFQVEDADWAFAEAVRRGAKPAMEPQGSFPARITRVRFCRATRRGRFTARASAFCSWTTSSPTSSWAGWRSWRLSTPTCLAFTAI